MNGIPKFTTTKKLVLCHYTILKDKKKAKLRRKDGQFVKAWKTGKLYDKIKIKQTFEEGIMAK
ncbi:MAG TPA: hypothetical protein DEG74_06000 [Clostridiales bacterium]|nr:hypothetical protein [Clostridiales bacterium]HBZ77292.1 hypothetical protein [Clostridiales bacterium]